MWAWKPAGSPSSHPGWEKGRVEDRRLCDETVVEQSRFIEVLAKLAIDRGF